MKILNGDSENNALAIPQMFKNSKENNTKQNKH